MATTSLRVPSRPGGKDSPAIETAADIDGAFRKRATQAAQVYDASHVLSLYSRCRNPNANSAVRIFARCLNRHSVSRVVENAGGSTGRTLRLLSCHPRASGYSLHSWPSSSRPPDLGRTPPHCLKKNACCYAPVAHLAHPLTLHRPRAGTAFAAGDGPVDVG